ncbi:MAG: DUF2007 domain-containing protein [Dehalococcoidia bacterium]|nr:DUF2007 domain-containing protein [Dehalococcoidia bacterium]
MEKRKEQKFVTVAVVNGELKANVLKSRLESEGIPVFLRYESAGRVYGFSINGLGEIKICVPQEFADDAKQILEESTPPPTDEHN